MAQGREAVSDLIAVAGKVKKEIKGHAGGGDCIEGNESGKKN